MDQAITRLEFTAIGSPATKGSVVAFVPKKKDGSLATKPDGSPMVVKHDDTGKKGKTWATQVSGAAFEAMVAGNIALMRDVPLVFGVDFYLPRPKSHFRSGRNSHLLAATAPIAPCTRPDVDKLLRAVLDALKNVVYADDGQVAAVIAHKHFGEPARAEITVCPVLPAADAEAPAPESEGQLALTAV